MDCLSVIQSIQAARAGSTTACYRPKWLGFQRWCKERGIEPLSCELGSILSFLQLLVDRGLAHSTVKVYAAAISSCHEGFDGRSAFSQLLRFLQGVRRLRPVVHASAPQWDLPLVLWVSGDSLRLPMGGRGGALSTVFRAHFLRGKRVRVCSVSRSPGLSTTTGRGWGGSR